MLSPKVCEPKNKNSTFSDMRFVRKRILRDLMWLALLIGVLAVLPIEYGPPKAEPTPTASKDWWEATYDACDARNQHEYRRAEAMFTKALELAGNEPTFLISSLESLAEVKRELGKEVEARALMARAAQLRYAHPR